jgi:hypothetical protein
MIISPANWQRELATLCEQLRAALGETKYDFNDFEFERSLYYLAISLRKLHDTPLRPNELDFYGWQFSGNYYSPRLPWFAVDAQFDMTKPRQGSASFQNIIDMIIHSEFVDCSYNSKAIIVGSDRRDSAKSNFIFEFSYDQLFRYCDKISKAEFHNVPPRKSNQGVKA